MADIDVEQKSSGQSTWIWAALAVLSVAALMFWLASQDVDSGPVAMEGDDAPADTRPAGGEAGATVAMDSIAAAPTSYVGSTVSVTAEVAATLGPRAFWANIEGQNPFLVVVDQAAGDPGVIAAGNELELTGTVGEVTEDLVDGWIAGGAVNDGARDEATFATHYFEATRIN